MNRVAVIRIVLVVFLCRLLSASHGESDLLKVVRRYADTMIEQGRDRYGSIHSPLFATTLNRDTLRIFTGKDLRQLLNIERAEWGIRPHDRMVQGANPMHHENFYQLLYALSEITGDTKYSQAADESLAWFFNHCQSSATSLFAWGEHMGWDFMTEAPIDKPAGTTHEFFRPWILWPRSYRLAPEPCLRFAKGLWEHQIGDPDTGDFSRHAGYDKHRTSTGSHYPRHGGFYIATWGYAYEHSKDPLYTHAILTLTNFFEGTRNPVSGAMRCETQPRSQNKVMWPMSNLSLAIDLTTASEKVPPETAKILLACAWKTDEVFIEAHSGPGLPQDGFLISASTETLAPYSHAALWETEYGTMTQAQCALTCLLRFRQTGKEAYKTFFLTAAEQYLTSNPEPDTPLWPGTFGHVISCLVQAYRLSGDERFLERARHFAETASNVFFDGKPLPKASSRHDHYEAVTLSDTLVMAFLELYLVRNPVSDPPSLIFTDR